MHVLSGTSDVTSYPLKWDRNGENRLMLIPAERASDTDVAEEQQRSERQCRDIWDGWDSQLPSDWFKSLFSSSSSLSYEYQLHIWGFRESITISRFDLSHRSLLMCKVSFTWSHINVHGHWEISPPSFWISLHEQPPSGYLYSVCVNIHVMTIYE